MAIKNYDRTSAVNYARKWAFGRNPAYYNFDALGGDCTNFVSQCVYAGAGIMNFTPVTGWYYISANSRTAAWTGVEYLYRFLTENKGAGPFGEEVTLPHLLVGDIVQFGNGNGDFYHSGIITAFYDNTPLITTHTFDALDRSIYSYSFQQIRFIHVSGVNI